jgi:hypothetical protein
MRCGGYGLKDPVSLEIATYGRICTMLELFEVIWRDERHEKPLPLFSMALDQYHHVASVTLDLGLLYCKIQSNPRLPDDTSDTHPNLYRSFYSLRTKMH